MNRPTFRAADLGLSRRDWEESAFYIYCGATPESERRTAESVSRRRLATQEHRERKAHLALVPMERWEPLR